MLSGRDVWTCPSQTSGGLRLDLFSGLPKTKGSDFGFETETSAKYTHRYSPPILSLPQTKRACEHTYVHIHTHVHIFRRGLKTPHIWQTYLGEALELQASGRGRNNGKIFNMSKLFQSGCKGLQMKIIVKISIIAQPNSFPILNDY